MGNRRFKFRRYKNLLRRNRHHPENARVVWTVENPDISEYSLAVWLRIPMGLEKGNRSMEHESGSKSRKCRDPAERF
ncbi:MAG: hypothetical protein SPF18_03395 [Blautia sp.]|nr:hypothetical protein [Blautia sp.]